MLSWFSQYDIRMQPCYNRDFSINQTITYGIHGLMVDFNAQDSTSSLGMAI